MPEYDLYINPQKPTVGLYVRKGQVSPIWPIRANGYLMALRNKSDCRPTLYRESKLAVTPFGKWVEF